MQRGMENEGSDPILGFYTRNKAGLSISELIIRKGNVEFRYTAKKGLWGIFKDPEKYELRIVYKIRQGKRNVIFGEKIMLDESTKISMKLSAIPPKFSPRHKLTARR